MAQKFHSLHETGSLPIFFYITRWAYSLYYFLTLQIGLTNSFFLLLHEWLDLWSICFLKLMVHLFPQWIKAHGPYYFSHPLMLFFFFFLGHIFIYHIKLPCCPSSNTLKKKKFKPLIFLLSPHFPRNPFKQRKVFMWEKPTPLG